MLDLTKARSQIFTVYGVKGEVRTHFSAFYSTCLTEGAIEAFALVISKLHTREMVVNSLVEE